MIIFRYLAREILYMTLTVTTIMVFIFLCNEVVRYLGFIASGKYASGMLLQLVLLGIPNMYSLLLPLGLFLGTLLAYSRLYAESEMIVLLSCGMSQMKLTRNTLIISTLITFLVGFLVLMVNPYIAEKRDQLMDIAQTSAAVQMIQPGQFQSSSNGQKVFYAQANQDHGKSLSNLFMAQQNDSIVPMKESATAWTVVSASGGHQQLDRQSGNYYLVTTQGYRYQGTPGEKDFQIAQYESYGVKLPMPSLKSVNTGIEATSTIKLAKAKDKHSQAEFQWRLAPPISAFILTLLAIPLSRVRPREGRFRQLFPATLAYIIYMNLLFIGRQWMQSGTISSHLGLWWIHGSMALIAIGLLIKRART